MRPCALRDCGREKRKNMNVNVEGKKILIIGTGKSGIAAAELLLAGKAVPVLFDENEKTDPEAVRAKLSAGPETEVLVGKLPEERQYTLLGVAIGMGLEPVQKEMQEGKSA